MLYNPSAPRAQLDLSLFWSVILLLAIGLVMVYSASIALPRWKPSKIPCRAPLLTNSVG